MKKYLWLVVFLLFPLVCCAHTIILESGENIECDEIRDKDGSLIMLWKADEGDAEYDYKKAVDYPFFEVKSVDGTPIDKTGKAVSYYLIAHRYQYKLKDYKSAIELYESAIRLEPPYSDVILDIILELMLCYNTVGRTSDSIKIGEKTIENFPDVPELHLNLGTAYALSHKDNEAILHYKKAISFSPSFAMAYGNLGVLYYELGRHKEAKENLLKAKELLSDENEKEMLLKVNNLLDKMSK